MKEIIKKPVDELFVIGNGFDLQCGLGTTYWNFLNDVFENNYKKYCKNIEGKTVLEQFEENQGVLLSQHSFSEHNWFEEMKVQYYPEINIWYRIFLHEKMEKSTNWSSVEEMMAKYLLEYELIENISAIVLKKKSNGHYITVFSDKLRSKKEIVALIAHSIIFKNLDSLNLQGRMPYEELRKIFYSDEKIAYEVVAELVTSILLNELKELEYDFECFVKKRLEITSDYLGNVSLLLKKMIDPEADWFGSGIDIDKISYNLLSFNYSSSWSEQFRPRHSPMAYLDVHGRIPKNDVKVSNIIFGIDHEKVEATSLEYRFTKTYRTLTLYSRNFENVGDNRDIYWSTITKVKFYGHSLAEADYSYFQQMFDYYKLYSNDKLELIFYYSVYDGANPEQIEQNQILSISRLIEKYGQTLDNQNHGKNLLTRLIQTNRLKLVKI